MADSDSETAKEVRSLKNTILFLVAAAVAAFVVVNALQRQDDAEQKGREDAECVIEGVRLGLSDLEIERRCGA